MSRVLFLVEKGYRGFITMPDPWTIGLFAHYDAAKMHVDSLLKDGETAWYYRIRSISSDIEVGSNVTKSRVETFYKNKD